jgi:ABC-type multidrug transport system fused ATPase/permease subunit
MVVLKMNLIRAILKEPKLLILVDSHSLTNRSKDMTITQILEKLKIPTLIISID